MPSFWKHVNAVLREADIIIEVLDARLVQETRNREIEEKVGRFGKKMLYVINKCDLVEKSTIRKQTQSLKPHVYISSTKHLGTTILKKKILELSRGNSVVVGVVGYPNVGKSSLINALAGRGAARTSAESGYTKGMQKIRVDNKIVVLDTPGVFPSLEKDTMKHGKIGAIDYAKIKDPEEVVLQLIEQESSIKAYYKVSGSSPEDILTHIGKKLGKLKKGGDVNREVAARQVLKDWQQGKI
jgi:ribosome biogenesis GTPase A